MNPGNNKKGSQKQNLKGVKRKLNWLKTLGPKVYRVTGTLGPPHPIEEGVSDLGFPNPQPVGTEGSSDRLIPSVI